MTASRDQALLRSLAASGSCFTAGAAGEAAVGSLNAARLLRSATRLVGRAAVRSSDLGTRLAAFFAAALATSCSRMAAAGTRESLRTHPIADQSQDRSGTQRHHISTIHGNLPNSESEHDSVNSGCRGTIHPARIKQRSTHTIQIRRWSPRSPCQPREGGTLLTDPITAERLPPDHGNREQAIHGAIHTTSATGAVVSAIRLSGTRRMLEWGDRLGHFGPAA